MTSRAQRVYEACLPFLEKRGKTVKVPKFKSRKAAIAFMKSLGPDDHPAEPVIDPGKSQEVLMLSKETRRQMLKKSYKDADMKSLFTVPFLLAPLGKTWDDETEFRKFYRVVTKKVGDSGIDVMVAVNRKDGKPFEGDDVANITHAQTHYNKSVLKGTGIQIKGSIDLNAKAATFKVSK